MAAVAPRDAELNGYMKDLESGADAGTRRPTLPNPPRNDCLSLQRAAMKGDWRAAIEIIRNDRSIVRASITENGETTLHIAAASRHVSFVQNLLEKMEPVDLEIQNNGGVTALVFAAATGIKEIAEVMVRKNNNLPTVHSDGATPLYMAVLQGHSDMAEYLLPISNFSSWTAPKQIELLNTCIISGLCGLALKLFIGNPGLAIECSRLAMDQYNDKFETPIHVLARKPSAFAGASQWALWRRTVNSLLAYVKEARIETEGHELFRSLWNHILQDETFLFSNITSYASGLLFTAAKAGNVEFLVELLSSCPELIFKLNKHKESIFHIAVRCRDEYTFNLIYEIGFKDLIASFRDDDGDGSILHLAAKLPPQNRLKVVSGAALQMQQELLWFKAVEKLVCPAYREMKNCHGQTPQELFTEEHKDLMKEGEKWMRGSATSCMLVAIVILLTVAFSVSGGFDNTKRAPILSEQNFYMVEAIALFFSSTSVLLFLSILISRYTEEDFINFLPSRLLLGITTLFISVAAVMLALCTSFVLPCHHGLTCGLILLVISACVPMVFIYLACPLLAAILNSTRRSCFMFQSRKRFLHFRS